jgi:hypothetical protein
MPDIEWSLLCEYCLLDVTGKLSMLGIFDQLVTPQLPVQQPTLFVVTRWRSEPNQTYMAETRLWTPTEQLLQTTGQVAVAPNALGHNLTINQFVGLTFDREGQYLVELLVEDETARYYPWQLTVQRPS